MKQFTSSCLLSTAVLVVGGLLAPAYGAQQPRLRGADLGTEAPVRIPETVRPLVRQARDQGRLPGTRVLHGITLHFKMSAAQQAELEELLREQHTPGSPNYQKWITPQEYAERFGVSQQDLDKVSAWLTSQGLAVEGISPSRDSVSFGGRVADVEKAFGTEMHALEVNGEAHFANSQEVSLPASLASMTLGVRHLDDFKPHAHARRLPTKRLTSNLTGNTFTTPDDFATIFGLKALYAAGIDGHGHTLAVVGATPITQGNVDRFRSVAGLPPSTVNQILVPNTGVSTVSTNDLVEAYLDVEWSGAVAKGATVNYYYVGNSQNSDVFDALTWAIDHGTEPVISISYGNCEANFGRTFTDMVRAEAVKAVSFGRTITAASGDAGAADCERQNATVASQGLGVDVPASLPEVTGIGGTAYIADVNASTQFWNTTNNANMGSARSYIGEGAWNDTTAGTPLSASGGGKSSFYTRSGDAPWQQAPGQPADDTRFVPDLSMPASSSHDGLLICSDNDCTNGFRNASTFFDVVGGTSAGAPTFAGLLTLIEQAVGSSGEGNLNSRLYPMVLNPTAYASAFHDITSGNNKVPCTAGSPDCSGGTLGFTTNTGFDLVTGLGSPDGYNLEEAYASVVKGNGKALTKTTVTGDTSTAQAGQNVTFTATVTGSPNGGNVQFLVDGDYMGSPVAVSNGTATFTTSFAAGGPHAITATYFGNANFAGSNSAPLAFTVGATQAAAFTVSASPNTLTLANKGGTSGTSTILVQGSNGFTSTVSLACRVAFAGTGTAGTLPTCALSSTQLNLSATNASGNSTATIAIPGTSGALRHSGTFEWMAAGSTAMFGCVMMVGGSRRRKLLGTSVLVLGGWMGGCGGVGPSPTPTSTGTGVVSGNYVVTITATPASGTAQSATVTVTVQ